MNLDHKRDFDLQPGCFEKYPLRALRTSLPSDQGGPATNFPTLSARDVLRMLRNSCVIEKAILEFEEQIVCRVRCTFHVPV